MDNDTENGGEELTLDEAVAAYVNNESEEADEGQSEDEVADESEEIADDELPESEEDEDEGEDEGDPDEEGETDDEDETEPDSDQGRFVASNGKVRLPDGTVSTVEDLVSGNLKDRDYRQKTMELAEQRRSVEEQSSTIKAFEQELQQEREYLASLMEQMKPQPPNPELLETDPLEFMKQEQKFKQYQEHERYVQYQRDQHKQKSDQETQQSQLDRVNQEWATLQEAVPEFKDPKTAESFIHDLTKFGQEYGFSVDEIRQTIPLDHRQSLVMRDAIKWQKLQASKANVQKKVKGRPPVTKGSKRLSKGARKSASATDAMKRLKQTGSVEDATAAFLATLDKG